MPDRYAVVRSWVQQGCRPIPCLAGTKHARDAWTRFQRHDPTIYDRHDWWTGKRQNNENVALILGPKPGGDLLVLNSNVKNGHNGPATLQRLGWILPPTPTILTPSTGLAYCFKVPAQVRAPFNTHVHPPGYDGIEFRGAKGYQLVPTSRTPEGAYTFVPPWTLERFRAELAELPDDILEAWIALDSPKILGRDSAQPLDKPRKPASTAIQPTTPLSPQPPHQRRSQSRPPTTAPTATAPITTITTRILDCNQRDSVESDVDDFEGAERLDARILQACAEHTNRLARIDPVFLSNECSFSCRLPGHGPDHHPSAV